MICQYCGHKLQRDVCQNPACPGRLIVHKFSLPDGKLVEIADERIWIYGPFDYLTTDEIDVIHAEIHRNDPDLAGVEDLLDHIISAANSVSIPSESNYLNELKSRLLATLTNATPYLSQDVIVPVEKLEAGRYRMMIPVEISTTGGLLLDRRDGLHGYSLEDYPNARFFKGW
jgi:hypothetical protein